MRSVGPSLAVALLLLATACGRVVDGQPVASPSGGDESLIAEYFQRSNAAAEDGAAAQKQFLQRTQHPDVPLRCDLGELTVLFDPSLGTLRPDDGWRPAGAGEVPRGRVYVVAVLATVREGETTVGTQVGSMHVVVLDAAAYGFAPCPS